jgi:hypothetical protein
MTTLDRLQEIGIVPVVALPDAALALPLAEALLEGGLRARKRLSAPRPRQARCRSFDSAFPSFSWARGRC